MKRGDIMPKYYNYGGFQFVLTSESNGVGYYTITHSSGRHWDYNHPFTSTAEMDDYVRAHTY